MDVTHTRVLIIDDERAITKLLEMTLRKEGFRQLFVAYNAADALKLLGKHGADIILLDVMLPDQTGFDLCPKIRELSDAHIIFLTARTSDLDVLTGFATGGDDYVTKPFNPLEIAARIKARVRRGNPSVIQKSIIEEKPKQHYDFGRFVLDEVAGELIVEGKEVACPAMVYQLLLFFCKNPGIVFSKGQLYETVWGIEGDGDDNTVMVHIRKIREKIESNPSEPMYLLTVRGLGYKMAKEKQL